MDNYTLYDNGTGSNPDKDYYTVPSPSPLVNEYGGFFRLPEQNRCIHHEHNPSVFLSIPNGYRYIHICPGCGARQEIYSYGITY